MKAYGCFLVLVVMGWSQIAAADFDGGTSRPLTAAEQAHLKTLQQQLGAALPVPNPAHWQLLNEFITSEPVCRTGAGHAGCFPTGRMAITRTYESLPSLKLLMPESVSVTADLRAEPCYAHRADLEPDAKLVRQANDEKRVDHPPAYPGDTSGGERRICYGKLLDGKQASPEPSRDKSAPLSKVGSVHLTIPRRADFLTTPPSRPVSEFIDAKKLLALIGR